MPIQPVSFNPLSFDQINAGIKGYQEGQDIARNTMQASYAPIVQNQQIQIQNQQIQKQQLANALAQIQLKNTQQYAGQQQQANIQNTQAQTGLYGAQGAQQQASANQANVGTVSTILNNLRQLQGFKQSIALNGGDTSSLDALIAQNESLLGQSAAKTGYGAQVPGNFPMNGASPGVPTSPQQQSPLSPQQLQTLHESFSPQQLQTLHAMNWQGGTPGAIGGNVTGGAPINSNNQDGLAQLSQSVSNSPISMASMGSPQDQQLQAIKRANLGAVYAAQSGSPELTSVAQTQLHLANEGNPLVNALDKADANTYQQARGDAKNAAELDNLTSRYEQVLKTIPSALFAPGINWRNSAFSGAIQNLQALSQQMIAHDAELTGVNKNKLTGSEFAQIGKSTAMPIGQYLSAVQGELGTLHSLANTHAKQFNDMNNYLNQHGNLSGFTFGALAGNSAQTGMVRIKGQDGKLYNIPSNNLSAALKRGATRVD